MGGAGLSAVLTRTRSPPKKGRIEMESKSEWGERARNIIKSVELNAGRELSGGESAVHHHLWAAEAETEAHVPIATRKRRRKE